MAELEPVVLPLFRAGVRNDNAAYWDNRTRLETAALIADEVHAPLVLAEGWKSNDLGDGVLLDGSDTAIALLDLMGLPKRAERVALHASCCTWQELAVVHERFPDHRIIAIANHACPSVKRAKRVVRLQGLDAEVYAPEEACVRFGLQRPDAGRKRSADRISEAINWCVHGISCIERRWSDPFEFRLARRLRQGDSHT